jgi:predicted dienelactone hydrolase
MEIDQFDRRKFLACLLATGSLSACSARPSFADPSAPAVQTRAAALAAVVPMPDDAAVQTHYLDWHDATRDRPVMAKVYLPASLAGKARASLPLVVVSHGLGGSRDGYSYIGKYLAARGHVCLHVQHIGSDRSLWTGNVLALVTRLQTAAHEHEAIHRVHDLRFALDQILTGPWTPYIDGQKIAVLGHSYGANSSLLACGATIQRGTPDKLETLNFRDERVRAAVLISAPPFYGMGDMHGILASVQVPTLHITSTADEIVVPGYHSAPDDRIRVYEAIGGPRKALAVFKDGSHSMFTDRLNTGGAEWNPKVKIATRELARAFLDRIFANNPTPMTHWAHENRPLLDRFEQNV